MHSCRRLSPFDLSRLIKWRAAVDVGGWPSGQTSTPGAHTSITHAVNTSHWFCSVAAAAAAALLCSALLWLRLVVMTVIVKPIVSWNRGIVSINVLCRRPHWLQVAVYVASSLLTQCLGVIFCPSPIHLIVSSRHWHCTAPGAGNLRFCGCESPRIQVSELFMHAVTCNTCVAARRAT